MPLLPWLPLGLGIFGFVWFALLCPPSFYWLDSAELSAAGVGLGSPHPTGFPVYMMLVKLASLVPIGEIAYRVNLLSAACAGSCVGIVSWVVINATRSRGELASMGGALVAATGLASSLLFARHAVVAEVYVPNAAMLAAMFLCFERTARTGDRRWGLLLAVICGLGLGLHSSFRMVAPIPVAILLIIHLRRGSRWPLYAPLLALTIGAATHLYLPVRTAGPANSAIEWGHPRDLGAVIDHVTAKRIRDSFSDQIASRNPEVVSVNADQFGQAVFDGMGPVLPLIAMIGLVWAFARRRNRALAFALAIAVVVDVVYSVWINPMGLVDGQNGTNMAVAAAIATGLGAAFLLVRTRWAAPFVAMVLAVIACAGPALVTWGELADAASHEIPRANIDGVAATAPPRTVILTQTDSLSAGLLFTTVVEGARPDVASIVRQHVADEERVAAVLRASAARPSDRRTAGFPEIVESGRPLVWELGIDNPPRIMRLEAGATVATLVKKTGPPPQSRGGDLAKAARDLRTQFQDRGDDPSSARHLAHRLTNLGRLAFGRGLRDQARLLFEAAVAARPSHAAALVNLGTVYSHDGDLVSALKVTEHALEFEPNRLVALVNAARYAHALGNDVSARKHIDKALALNPAHRGARRVAADIDRDPLR